MSHRLVYHWSAPNDTRRCYRFICVTRSDRWGTYRSRDPPTCTLPAGISKRKFDQRTNTSDFTFTASLVEIKWFPDLLSNLIELFRERKRGGLEYGLIATLPAGISKRKFDQRIEHIRLYLQGESGSLATFRWMDTNFQKNSPVALDILGAVLHVSQSFGSILNEQLLDQILGDGIHVTWPFNFTGQDLLVDTERVVVEKWRVTGQHLVDQDPCSQQKFQRPYSTQRSLPLSNANFNHFFFWFVPLGESRRESRASLHVALLWRLIKSFRSFGKEILAFLRNLEARATRPCWIFINHRSLTRVWWITCLISHSTWF